MSSWKKMHCVCSLGKRKLRPENAFSSLTKKKKGKRDRPPVARGKKNQAIGRKDTGTNYEGGKGHGLVPWPPKKKRRGKKPFSELPEGCIH